MALRRRGFTLIELMVSIGVLSALGLALTVVLRSSIRLWHAGEARREAYEEAERVFRAVRSDLSSMYTGRSELGESRGILLCHRFGGQQRLVFVNTIAATPADPFAQRTGLAWSDGRVDNVGDQLEAAELRLMATGGLEEVQWMLDPRGSGALYRARRSPIHGPGSLFYTPIPLDSLAARAQVMSDRVLYIGWEFWSQSTRSWSGGLDVWDSTRSVKAFDSPRADFSLFHDADSITDSRDDVFPARIRVTLVLEDPIEGVDTLLAEDISASEDDINLIEEDRFRPDGGLALVGTEWITYRSYSGTRLRLDSQGRGARGTTAQEHAAGTRVRTGRLFMQTFAVPGFREDWGGRR